MTAAKSAYAIGFARARRSWATLLAAAGLLIVLATLAAAILLSHDQSRSQIQSAFQLRGMSSARFVSTYVDQQANRQREVARRSLAAPRVSPIRFKLIVGALGSGAATLSDGEGRMIDVLPDKPPPPGSNAASIAPGHNGLTAPRDNNVTISGVNFAPNGNASTAVAVSYLTSSGTRVLSVDYASAGLGLDALVDHTISYSEHEVYIVDSAGRLLSASPRSPAGVLVGANAALARATAHASHGTLTSSGTPSTFTAAPVPGTSWRLLIIVPDKRLYASVAGWTLLVPWLVFALVTVFGLLLVALLARSLADRARLTKLSATMRRTAQTDSLTGLYNRRALTEHLTRAAARARRHEESLSVLMIDLDRFKQTNDQFGHEAGDQVLCTVADCLRDVLRADDIFGRWGGDEFLVALPVTDAHGASVTAARLRKAASTVELAGIGLPDGIPLSIGAATGVQTGPIELIRQADLALYRAKAAGRDDDVLASR